MPDDGSYYSVVIAPGVDQDNVCCVPTATCAAATCKAGYKKKANVETLSCHGNRDKCVDVSSGTSICCEADKTTCGGLKASSGISCGYGTYDESELWTLTGDKKTSQATMDAWNSKPATKSADCCTAAASCTKEISSTTPAVSPAPLPVTTTPVAPIRRYSENDAVFQERQASRSASNLPLVAAGAFAGMAVLMLVQGLRSRMSTRELIDGAFSE